MRKLNPKKLYFLPSPHVQWVRGRTSTQLQNSCIQYTLYCAMHLLPTSLKSQHPGLLSLSLWYFWISWFLCDYGRDKNLGEEHSCFSVAHRYSGQACVHDMDLSEDNQPPSNQALSGLRTWVGIVCIHLSLQYMSTCWGGGGFEIK